MSSYATPMQELFWHGRAQDPSLPWGTFRFSRELKGDLDVNALRAAFRGVIGRHEALRTSFRERDGVLQRSIMASDPRADLEVLDLRGLDGDERDACIAPVRAWLAAPFDAATGPLIRGKLVRSEGDAWTVLLALDHLIFDGMSIRILFQDLWAYYRSFTSGAAPRFAMEVVPFSDFADFQQQAITGPQFAHQRAYWEQKLADSRVRIDLPLRADNEAVTSTRLDVATFPELSRLTAKVDALAAKHRVTTFSVLTAAVAIALTSYGDDESILMGSFWANRHRFWNKALVGLVADFVPLSLDVDRGRSVRDLVVATRQEIAQAFANGDISPMTTTGHIPMTFNPPREAAGTACGPEAWVNYVEGHENLAGRTDRAMDFELPPEEFPGRGAPLMFFMRRSRGALSGMVGFNKNLFANEEVERIARRAERAIESMVARPFGRVGEVIEDARSCA